MTKTPEDGNPSGASNQATKGHCYMAKVDSTSCFYVYVHRRATDGRVFYVGKGKGHRAWASQGRSNYWRNIVAKHGLIVEIVQDAMQEWWAFEMECELIALYGRENLCNLTDGGEGASGAVRTQETKNKMSASQSNESVKLQKSNALKSHWAKDGIKEQRAETLRMVYVNNPELREKMRSINAERSKLPEFRKKLSDAHMGRKFTEETKNKLRDKANNMTAEHKRKLSECQMGALNHCATAVVCNETGQVFETIKSAVDWLKSIGKTKAASTPITRNIQRRKYKKAYGYTWRYA